jgi:hypothetical protein
MRRIFIIATILQFVSFSFSAQDSGRIELEQFNEFIGESRAVVLQEAVDSFDRFLIVNYPELENQSLRTKAFLEEFVNPNSKTKKWTFDESEIMQLKEAFEKSGLRKEILLFGYENYESNKDFSKVLPPDSSRDTKEIKDLGELELDLIEEEIIPIRNVDRKEEARIEQEERVENSLRPNYKGDYVYALLKSSPKDSFVYEYSQAFILTGNKISLGVLANGFLYSDPDYDHPLVKRLLVTDFYYWLINK